MRRREFIAGLGSAAAWPVVARAQQAAVPVVGFLDLGPPRPDASYVAAFRQGLAAAGFVEGQTVAIEYRWANNQGARLAPLAAELVQRQVAVIVALGGPPVLAAKAASSTIPIVFSIGADPIEFGLVASLSRPGGNMTGVTGFSAELTGKRLDLLCQMAPLATTVAYITDPGAKDSYAATREMFATARALGRQAIILEARSGFDIDKAFATLVERGAGALVVGPHILFGRNFKKLIDLAARYRIPTIYPGRGFTVAGGLYPRWFGGLSPDRLPLCRADSQGRQTGRPAGPAADQVRARHQPQNRKGARSDRPRDAARRCRRGDRVGVAHAGGDAAVRAARMRDPASGELGTG